MVWPVAREGVFPRADPDFGPAPSITTIGNFRPHRSGIVINMPLLWEHIASLEIAFILEK